MNRRLLWTFDQTLVTTLAWPDRHKADNYYTSTSLTAKSIKKHICIQEKLQQILFDTYECMNHIYVWIILAWKYGHANSNMWGARWFAFPFGPFWMMCLSSHPPQLPFNMFNMLFFSFLLSVAFLPRDLLLGVIGRCHTLNTSKNFNSKRSVPEYKQNI